MTKLQKTVFFLVAWLASSGLMAIHMGLSLNIASNTRYENLAILLGGTVIWAALMATGYMVVGYGNKSALKNR